MWIIRGIALARKNCALGPFVSSLKVSLHCMCTAYTTFHMVCMGKTVLIGVQTGINEVQTLCTWYKAVEISILCCVVPWWVNSMWCNQIGMHSNLVLNGPCCIQRGPLLQPTCCKISFVPASNAMDQMLLCCIVVFLGISNQCQCGASANAFATCHVA